VYCSGDPEQSCGQLVSVARHPDGDYALLVVAQINRAEGADSLHLAGVDGPPLRLEAPPYPFPHD